MNDITYKDNPSYFSGYLLDDTGHFFIFGNITCLYSMR